MGIRLPANMRKMYPPKKPVWIVLRHSNGNILQVATLSNQVYLSDFSHPFGYPGWQRLKAFPPGFPGLFWRRGWFFNLITITGFRVYQMDIVVLCITDSISQHLSFFILKLYLRLWYSYRFYFVVFSRDELNIKWSMCVRMPIPISENASNNNNDDQKFPHADQARIFIINRNN